MSSIFYFSSTHCKTLDCLTHSWSIDFRLTNCAACYWIGDHKQFTMCHTIIKYISVYCCGMSCASGLKCMPFFFWIAKRLEWIFFGLTQHKRFDSIPFYIYFLFCFFLFRLIQLQSNKNSYFTLWIPEINMSELLGLTNPLNINILQWMEWNVIL